MFNDCSESRVSIDDYLDCISRLNIINLVDRSLISATFETNASESRTVVTAHFNNQGYHIPPLTLNLVSNALLKSTQSVSAASSSILVINHPLPRNISEVLQEILENDPTSFNVASGLTFGFGFLLASFVVFLIKEKTTSSRHIQYLSGCSPLLYWTNAFIWDFMAYMIPTAFVMVQLWVR